MATLVDRWRYWGAERRTPAREDSTPGDELPARFASASEAAIRNEDLQALEACFDELPEDYRRILVAARAQTTGARLVVRSWPPIAAGGRATEGCAAVRAARGGRRR